MSSLRDEYEALNIERIQKLVADRRQEDLLLDFKTVPAGPTSADAIRKVLAKSLSGFANSAGGLIIWGVDCRRNNGIDAANESKPVSDPEKLLTELQNSTSHATSPIVDGVLHRMICVGDGTGYVITYVPESFGGPHMAKFGHDYYFKRSGSQFRRMEHFDIADMFGRRAAPLLGLYCTVRLAVNAGVRYSMSAIVGIENAGRAPALYPALEVDISGSPQCRICEYGLDGNGRTGLPKVFSPLSGPKFAIFGGGVNDIVHVNSHLEVTRINFDIDDMAKAIPPVLIDYRILSNNTSPVFAQRVVSPEEILAALRLSQPRACPSIDVLGERT